MAEDEINKKCCEVVGTAVMLDAEVVLGWWERGR